MTHVKAHTKTLADGKVIDILKLHDLLENREVISMLLEDIKLPSRSKRSGFSHKRLEDADISYPLVIDENRFLIDGRHRFFKMLEAGKKSVKVKTAMRTDIDNILK